MIGLRDCSHYDVGLIPSLAGFGGATSKCTEGTSYVDVTYGTHLNGWRGPSDRVLGSYHVLHTGNLDAQLSHWFAVMDGQTPWWRDYPYFILQIDAEKWPGDDLSADTVKSFSAKTRAKAPANVWVVTYASRGQFGDNLRGIDTDLWNAAYGANNGIYPGDTSSKWAAYSGRTPAFLQYASNPYDKNAFRGSLNDLLARFPKGATDVADDVGIEWINRRVEAMSNGYPTLHGNSPQKGSPQWMVTQINSIVASLAGLTELVKQAVALGNNPLTAEQVAQIHADAVTAAQAAARADLEKALDAAHSTVQSLGDATPANLSAQQHVASGLGRLGASGAGEYDQ